MTILPANIQSVTDALLYLEAAEARLREAEQELAAAKGQIGETECVLAVPPQTPHEIALRMAYIAERVDTLRRERLDLEGKFCPEDLLVIKNAASSLYLAVYAESSDEADSVADYGARHAGG